MKEDLHIYVQYWGIWRMITCVSVFVYKHAFPDIYVR